MDFGLTITGIIMFAICSLPFVLPYFSRKKQKKQLFQSLLTIAEQQNCKITQHECWGDFIIGLDEAENALFYYKNKNDNEIKTHINLSDIQNCKVITTSKSNENNNSMIKFTEKIELNFSSITKNNPNFLLEFYNAQDGFQTIPDILLIGKWEKIINERLKSKKISNQLNTLNR